jgi:predicted metal-dependent phosphotriesterase family hydrolase
MTVRGPIRPEQMGRTLPHEHVLVDFVGAAEVGPHRYDSAEVLRIALPHLQQVRSLGFASFVECTPAYLARDPRLLQQLSEATDLHILTNTGYYGARNNQFLPAHAASESAAQLSARWVREWTAGIDGTGIRPGFIKIGVDGGPLSDLHRKLVSAAALTHLQSGLTTAAHTGDGEAALEQIDLFEAAGVRPEAWIWVHAHTESNAALHVEAGRRGAWVSFDGVAPDSVRYHVDLTANMKRSGLLHRVLVSHDAGWYHVGEPGGGPFRPYDTLHDAFLPALQDAGFSEEELRQLVQHNPATAFSIRVRRVTRAVSEP